MGTSPRPVVGAARLPPRGRRSPATAVTRRRRPAVTDAPPNGGHSGPPNGGGQPPAEPNFTWSPAKPITGDKVSFTVANVGQQRLSWSFAGGAPATSPATGPTVIWSDPGPHRVDLVLISGTSTRTVSHVVTVSTRSPTVEFHWSAGPTATDPVKFFDDSTGVYHSPIWTFSGSPSQGITTAAGTTVTWPAPNPAPGYTATLTVIGADRKRYSAHKSVPVMAAPVASFTVTIRGATVAEGSHITSGAQAVVRNTTTGRYLSSAWTWQGNPAVTDASDGSKQVVWISRDANNTIGLTVKGEDGVPHARSERFPIDLSPCTPSGSPLKVNPNPSAAPQPWAIPAGCTYRVTFTVDGAQGGGKMNGPTGGKGAHLVYTTTVTGPVTYALTAGGKGDSSPTGMNTGINGGGDGQFHGGGMSEVAIITNGIAHDAIIAAGGGGAGEGPRGGNGGGSSSRGGNAASAGPSGQGGEPGLTGDAGGHGGAGGAGGEGDPGANGSSRQGGSGGCVRCIDNAGGGGGGGGYFGGGGGGGGGSSANCNGGICTTVTTGAGGGGGGSNLYPQDGINPGTVDDNAVIGDGSVTVSWTVVPPGSSATAARPSPPALASTLSTGPGAVGGLYVLGTGAQATAVRRRRRTLRPRSPEPAL